jgi:two-component system, sensor histidine kinase and response regulator
MKPGKILIIDDFKTNIFYLTRLLEGEGYEIYSGDNAIDALNFISKIEFDLILLDVVMPDADGYQICEMVRKSSQNNTTPVIFITSRNDEKSILRGFELGGQDYVIRPFNNSELIARVNTHIELKRNRVQLKSLNLKLERAVSKRTFELKAALAKLNLSYKKLKKAQKEILTLDKAKENFLRIINHEIRTPLNGIMGFQELLKRNCQDVHLLDYLEMMQSSVQRLEKFSMDALLLTQLKTGKYKLDNACLNISNQIEQMTVQFMPSILAEQIKVQLEIDDALIYTDENLFQYAFRNLLENAIHHSPQKSSILIKGGKVRGDYYQIQIIDKGKGFPSEILDNKYRLFINDEVSDNRPGLALFTIRLIMKYLQGKMQLSNCENGGASAIIKIKSQEVLLNIEPK